MFYTFRQNNSGGFFTSDPWVIVEATSDDDVNSIATTGEKYISITTGPLAGRITKK